MNKEKDKLDIEDESDVSRFVGDADGIVVLGKNVEITDNLTPEQKESTRLHDEALRKARAFKPDASLTASVENLLGTVRATAKAHEVARQLYQDRHAPDFNPFQFVETDELTLSRLIAWMLNPKETHGQGSRFLVLFLRALGKEWPQADCDTAEVLSEVHTRQGQLDIEVRAASRSIVIENKPWAGDQDGQLARYFSYLESTTDRCMIYLTPDGTHPSSSSLPEGETRQRIAAGELHLWDYRGKLLDWLEQCRVSCRAERVASFIGDFAREVRRLFTGIQDMTEQQHIVDAATKTADDVLAAMTVIVAGGEIRSRLLAKLRLDIAACIPDSWSVELDIDGANPKERSSINIVYGGETALKFSIEFWWAKLRGLYFGIYSDARWVGDAVAVRSMLDKELGRGKQDPRWPWYRPTSPHDAILAMERDWGSTAEPWRQIATGEAARKIAEVAKRFHDVLSANKIL